MTDNPKNVKRLVHKGFYYTDQSFEEVFDRLGQYKENGTIIEHIGRNMLEFSETYAEIEWTSYGIKPSYLITILQNYEKVIDEDFLSLIDLFRKQNYVFGILISEFHFKNIDKKKDEIARLIPNSLIVKESKAIEAGLSYGEVLVGIYVGIDILGKIDGTVGGGTIIYNGIKKILRKTPKVELSRKVANLIIKKIKKEFNDECYIDSNNCELHENFAITCICYSNNQSENKYKVIYNSFNNKVEVIKLRN